MNSSTLEKKRVTKECTEIKATPQAVKCPHCGAWLDGLIGDPRGKDVDCDECGQRSIVSHASEITFD